jgi:uncharacterized protein (TIGR01777 family)
MNILITGGTGFVGRHLGQKLSEKGHTLYVLTRDKSKYPKKDKKFSYECTFVDWNDLASEKLYNIIDTVINLAGESIAQLWTAEHKNKILRSRVDTTRELVNIFKDSNLKTFISASAIGFYGDRKEEVLTERSSYGDGFLANVCGQWEKEANKMSEVAPSVRVCIVRTGLVLGDDGGALELMAPIFKFGLGGPVGKGLIWMSWIQIDDLVDLYVWLVENNKAHGVYNGVSPRPVRNKEFCELLAGRFDKRTFIPAPKFLISKLLGELSETILMSQRVEPIKALDEGFLFKYPALKDALRSLDL